MGTLPILTRDDAVRIVPLGGLGEVGLNLLAIEAHGKILLVDCGLMFPEPQMLGIDLVLPDVAALDDRRADLCGILLTHGHEDHIGAVPYLLDRLGSPPLYATPLTLGLLRARLDEHDFVARPQLSEIVPRVPFAVGPFRVEAFRVTHSIVDGVGFAIDTPAGRIVHTGDFKLDATPVDGRPTDLGRLATYGEEGVLLLLSDSTNVERPGHTLSEREVGAAFQQILPRCPGWAIIATFSSNIHRLQQAIDAAVVCGRKVHVNGRSMVANIAIARQLGYLHAPDDLFIDLRQLRELPRQEVLILSTGSQGEPLSALARIAMDDHQQIRLAAGDTVILSAKFIPGNERTITDLINHLYRRGAEVYYETTSEVHVSGHACREELKTMLALVRPRHFVPVHGEYRHLVMHGRLAAEMGIPEERIHVIDNGQPLLLTPNGARREERVDCGRIFVDGKGVDDLGGSVLRDRHHLAHHGMVVVLLGLRRQSGELVHGPEFFSRGFVPEEEQTVLDEARAVVAGLLGDHSLAALGDSEELRLEIRKALRRHFNRTRQRRPVIIPVIMEL